MLLFWLLSIRRSTPCCTRISESGWVLWNIILNVKSLYGNYVTIYITFRSRDCIFSAQNNWYISELSCFSSFLSLEIGSLYKKVPNESCIWLHNDSMSAFFVKSIETKVEALELVKRSSSTSFFWNQKMESVSICPELTKQGKIHTEDSGTIFLTSSSSSNTLNLLAQGTFNWLEQLWGPLKGKIDL